MSIGTRVVAVFWIVVSAPLLALGALYGCGVLLLIGAVPLVACAGLLLGKTWGWWALTALTAARVVTYVIAAVHRAVGVWAGREPFLFDSGFDYLHAALFVPFCLALVVLIVDRPSKWHAPAEDW